MVSVTRSALARLTAAYFLPFAALITLDLLLGRTSYSFSNDNIAGFFGLGLNITTLSHGLRFHHPGYTVVELAGVLATVFRDAPDLRGFFAAGIAVHLAIALGAALWVARLAAHLRLGTAAVAALSLMVLSMPTVTLYGSLLCTYAPAGLLLVPLGLGTLAILSEDSPPTWVVRSTLLGMGVMAANLFTSLVLPVALTLVLAVIVWRQGAAAVERRLGQPILTGSWANAVLTVLLALLVRNLLDAAYVLHPLPFGRGRFWIATAVIMGGVGALAIRYRPAGVFGRTVLLPVLLGWFAACNVFVMSWGNSAGQAFMTKGSASPRLPVSEVLHRADPIRFLLAWNWHVLLLAGLVAAAALAAPALGRRASGGALAALAALVALVLTVMLAADVSFLRPSGGLPGFGQESRYMLAALAPLAMVVGVLVGRGPKLRAATVAAVCVGSAASLRDFAAAALVLMPSSAAIEQRLTAAIDAHLAADPANLVFCVRTVQPAPCEMLYGFNNYRLPASIAKLPRNSLAGERVRYAIDKRDAAAQFEQLGRPGQALLIVEGGPAAVILDTEKPQ